MCLCICKTQTKEIKVEYNDIEVQTNVKTKYKIMNVDYGYKKSQTTDLKDVRSISSKVAYSILGIS